MSPAIPPQLDNQPATDNIIYGDEVRGAKIDGHQIIVSDITHSTAIAVGVNITQNVHLTDPNTARGDLAFEQKYCQAVIHRLDRLELFGLPRLDQLTSQQPLSIAYINLAFTLTAENIQKLGEGPIFDRLQRTLPAQVFSTFCLLLNAAKHGNDPLAMSGAAIPRARITSQRLADPALLTHFFLHAGLPRLVIHGKAGSGKSTLLQWLAIQHATMPRSFNVTQPLPLVPFFLRLREFVGRGFPAPEDFPRATVPQLAGSMPHGWVHRLLDAGRAVILIDGVDEMPQSERPTLLQSLQALMTTYPHVTYLVTSRPAAVAADKWPEWTGWMHTEDFLPLVIDDMTPDQADHLIDYWHQALCHQHRHDERAEILTLATRLKRQLATRPELRRLTVSPLLCAMLCAVHHDRRQDLPRERARLYQECVELLLNRRDQGRKIELAADYPTLTESQKEDIVQTLAYWFLKNGYSTAEFADVDAHINSLLRLMQVGAATSQGVRRLLIERASLLREPSAGWVDFPHRTFLEYLAAQAAVKASDFGVLLEHARDDQWRETIILAMATARPDECTRFLHRLIKKADNFTKNTEARHQLYLLAAACLETPVRRDPAIEALVLDRVRQLLPPSSEGVIPALAKVGNALVPLLAPDPDYSSEEAAYCIRVLAQIATADALDQLAAYVADQRWRITEAITAAWSNFERNVYIDQVLSKLPEIFIKELPSHEELALFSHITNVGLLLTQQSDISRLNRLHRFNGLDVSRCQVSNIDFVKEFSQLESLNLDSTQVTDLTPLSNLHFLHYLSIRETQVQEIFPLSFVRGLADLSISRTAIHDLAALSQLETLRSLTLDANQFKHFCHNSGPPHLSRLSIEGVAGEFLDLFPLGALPNLSYISLSKLVVKDFSVLSLSPQLKSLWLGQTKIDIEQLTSLQNLTTLTLVGSNAINLHYLSQLANLEDFFINTPRFDLDLLGVLNRLKRLNIWNCEVPTLAPLAKLTALEELFLSVKQAQDLQIVAALPHLQQLSISGPGRFDRASLANRPDLKIIRV